jgi:hypothetical protein
MTPDPTRLHDVTVHFMSRQEYYSLGRSSNMPRRRGNPNWGKPPEPIRTVATEFEKEVNRLGLTKKSCASSSELRRWCERNKNHCYIPEWLLQAWGIEVDTYQGPL